MSDTNETKSHEQIIKDLQAQLLKGQEEWNGILKELTAKIRSDLKNTLELETEAISVRQQINIQLSQYMFRLNVDAANIRTLMKARFEYYATKYQIKTSGGEKTKLSEADLTWQIARRDLLGSYIEFLGETRKTVDHIIWSVKNKIELYNILGTEG